LWARSWTFGSYEDIPLGTSECVCLSKNTLRPLNLLCSLHPPPISQQSPPSPPPCFSSCSSEIRGVLPQRPLEAFGMWCLCERTNISFYCLWGRLIEYLFVKYIFTVYSTFIKQCKKQNILRVDLFTGPLYRLSVVEDRCFWGLLGCYAALIGCWLPTFRDRLLVSSSRVKQSFLVILKQIAWFPFLNDPLTQPDVLPWIGLFLTTYIYIYMYGAIP